MEKTKELNKYKVRVRWNEVHEGFVEVDALSEEEAHRLACSSKDKHSDYLKKYKRTFIHKTDVTVETPVELVKEDLIKEDELFIDRLNKDVYAKINFKDEDADNVLTLGRSVYDDFMYNRQDKYSLKHYGHVSLKAGNYLKKLSGQKKYRYEVIFKEGDFRKMLDSTLNSALGLNSLRLEGDESCNMYPKVASSVEDLLDGEGSVLLLTVSRKYEAQKDYKITLDIKSVEKYSYKTPYRIQLNDDLPNITFLSGDELADTINNHYKISMMEEEDGTTNAMFVFLNTPEHLEYIEKLVERTIKDTLS